uniref:RNA binding motif protein 28 n=1 Tax=Gadus morhua TaxID=8049 RepID=A0A8C5CG34_GADMO
MGSHTLFVKSLPDSASNERLTEIFSEIGPVKHCFVVNEKGTKQCRGFGYVMYAMEDDALQALKEVKSYDGKRISVSIAKKKKHDKKRPEGEEKEGPPKETQKKPLKEGPPKETQKKPLKIEPPKETPKKAPPKQGPPKEQPQKCGKEESPKEGTPKQQQPKEEAPKAQPPKEEEPTFKGIRKSALKSKLIIRNISFKCSEDDLKQTFSAFGEVLETKIPLKADGKMRGFGFVLFKNMSGAGKALKAMNMKEIKGNRPPLCPFSFHRALSKKAAKQLKEASSDDEEDSDNGEESEEEADEEDGGSFDSDEEDYEDDDDEDDDDSDDDLDRKPRKPLPSDVNEGRTIFIRNLSFDTEEEALEEALLRFGELNYIKIVLHPDTDHSKGCAFAQFKRKESAEKCIAMTQDDAENGGVRVDGRRLIVSAAVSRESAAQLKDKKVKVETGARNLYLAREGLIRAGTKAAEGVPEADMVKRTRFEEVKRTKLRDINVYVSKTRLCVHNLPKSVDNTKLKDICFQALSRARGVRIPECRVMYDRKPEKGKAMGLSLGYGFVEFQCPDHALSTLRHLNNNPDIFGPTKRPIVEFSLEDGRKLKLKEARQLKNKTGCVVKFKTEPGAAASLQPAGQNNTVQAKRKMGMTSLHFSGFLTKPEVEYVELEDGKKKRKTLPFPSHRGPKIRLRDKGKQQAPPKKPKGHTSRKDRQAPSMSAKPGKKPFRNREEDRFDSMVEKYKNKILGGGQKTADIKRNKWFS